MGFKAFQRILGDIRWRIRGIWGAFKDLSEAIPKGVSGSSKWFHGISECVRNLLEHIQFLEILWNSWNDHETKHNPSEILLNVLETPSNHLECPRIPLELLELTPPKNPKTAPETHRTSLEQPHLEPLKPIETSWKSSITALTPLPFNMKRPWNNLKCLGTPMKFPRTALNSLQIRKNLCTAPVTPMNACNLLERLWSFLKHVYNAFKTSLKRLWRILMTGLQEVENVPKNWAHTPRLTKRRPLLEIPEGFRMVQWFQ